MRDIVDAIVRANSVACNDEVRFFLCGVCLKQRDGKLDVVATDGHMMIVETFDLPESLTHLKEFIIPRDEVKKIEDIMSWVKRFHGRKAMIPQDAFSIRISPDHKEAILSGRDFSITLYPIEGAYPDYTKVLPNAERKNLKIGFDLKKLRAVFEALDKQASTPDHVQLLVDLDNNLNSLLISTPSSKTQGIVMPVRL